MKAIVVIPFDGLPDGQMVVRRFVEGDEVTGELAKVAVREKWAKPDSEAEPQTKKSAAPATTKAGKGSKRKPEPDLDPGDGGDDDQGEGGGE